MKNKGVKIYERDIRGDFDEKQKQVKLLHVGVISAQKIDETGFSQKYFEKHLFFHAEQ